MGFCEGHRSVGSLLHSPSPARHAWEKVAEGRMRALWCNVFLISTSILAEAKSPHPPSRRREAKASLWRSRVGHPLPLLRNGRGGKLEVARSLREIHMR